MGTERDHISDTAFPLPLGISCVLERLSTTISVVEERIRGNALHIGRVEFVRERYTLVAAIVTMIILGVWIICVVEDGLRNR